METKLKYTFKNDILFKMLFLKKPKLLKKFISIILGIKYESITEFIITNSEMPPEGIGDKFCRVDIHMIVDGRHVNLEIQVENEGNFKDRSLYHWARMFSSALASGNDYSELPQTIVISILDFKLFDFPEYKSEFSVLEITRYTPLSDKMWLIYFELPKLTEDLSTDNILELWLNLFDTETKERLDKIESLGVSDMNELIEAYNSITVSPEFQELERLREKARHDEAQALHNAEHKGEQNERKKWQGIVAEKDSVLAKKDAVLAEKDVALAEKDAENVRQKALIDELMKRLGENN